MITITINKFPTFYIDMDLVENIENMFVFFVQKARKILILNIDFHIDFRPSTFGHVFVFWIHDMHVLLSQFWLTEISSILLGKISIK